MILTCGFTSFSSLWNELLLVIRSAKDINIFKSLLKTHFFRIAFDFKNFMTLTS